MQLDVSSDRAVIGPSGIVERIPLSVGSHRLRRTWLPCGQRDRSKGSQQRSTTSVGESVVLTAL